MVGLKSFELYSPKMQMALCRVVRYESFGKGRVIVRKEEFHIFNDAVSFCRARL